MNGSMALSCCLFPLMLSAADIPSHHFTIHLPTGVPAESVFLRYQFPEDADSLFQALQPDPGVGSIVINTSRNGHPASRIRGLLAASGCAIQQFDVPLPALQNTLYAFRCLPIPNAVIRGAVVRLDRLYGRPVEICAQYTARWGDGIATVPIGHPAPINADGKFELTIPDLTRDPAASSGAGGIHLWAKELGTGQMVARIDLNDAPEIRTRSGGIAIRANYRPDLVFAPCAVNPPQRQDSEGFHIRPDHGDACGDSQKFDLKGFANRQDR